MSVKSFSQQQNEFDISLSRSILIQRYWFFSHRYPPLHIYTQHPFPAVDSHSKIRHAREQRIGVSDALVRGDAFLYTDVLLSTSQPPQQARAASAPRQPSAGVPTVTDLTCWREIRWPSNDYLDFRGSMAYFLMKLMTLSLPFQCCAFCDVAGFVETRFCQVLVYCASASFRFFPWKNDRRLHCRELVQQQEVEVCHPPVASQPAVATCVYYFHHQNSPWHKRRVAVNTNIRMYPVCVTSARNNTGSLTEQ